MSELAETKLSHFHSPGTVISRFVAKRTMRGAAFWALVFGLFVAVKATGFATAYPTMISRIKLAASFGNNIGLKALLGVPHNILQVSGFAAWNSAGGIVIIGSIWGFLLATKSLRGEEDNGRWEILLSGQTTARRAAANVIAGLSLTLAIFFVILSVVFVGVGHLHKIDYPTTDGLFYALTILCVVATFILIGCLMSQLMPTRSRAASAAAAIFAICFFIRAVADTTTASWLLNFTPLGWAEKAQPLAGNHGQWLIPLVILIVLLITATIYLAGKRDLGASTFSDRDTAKARIRWLNTPLEVAIRLTRSASAAWLLGIGLLVLFFSLLTKSAAQAFSQSVTAEHKISAITHSNVQAFGALTFLSIVFLIVMCLIMACSASGIGAIREEEADGLLDNIIVRPVSRLRWLMGRLIIVTSVSMMAGIVSGITSWVGVASQHDGVSFHTLILAGINGIIPAIVVIGLGTFALGFIPRLTSFLTYGLVAWSFLLDILSSGININHWILDTSIFQHVALAPAISPNWHRDLIIIGIAAALTAVGMLAFNYRDLQSE